MSEKNTNPAVKANPPAQPAPIPKRPWLKIALIASLMLNALFIGAIGMRMYHVKQSGGWHHGGSGPVVRMGLGRFFKELPRARRKELRKQFGEMRRNMRDQRGSLRKAGGDVIEILRSDNLDVGKLTAALAALSTARSENAKRNNDYLIEVIKTLTPAERKAMADAMTRRRDRRDKRRRKREKNKQEN